MSETTPPLTPDPVGSPPPAEALPEEVARARSSLTKAVELAKRAGDEAQEVPGEVIDLIERAIEGMKSELDRLKHVIHFNKTAAQGEVSSSPATQDFGAAVSPPVPVDGDLPEVDPLNEGSPQ